MDLPSKEERLREFFRRLSLGTPPTSSEEAYLRLCSTLDDVEDELSGQPNEPDRWDVLDRMFPPQSDRRSTVAGGRVLRFDSRRQVTYIGANGAIEIRSKRRAGGDVQVLFSRVGGDGRSLTELCPELARENL